MSANRIAYCILLAAFVWTVGCAASVRHPDPLAGWKYMYTGQLDEAIIEDYEAFIQKLPPKERGQVGKYRIHPYENGMGGHAVRFEIGIDGLFDGTWWDYVLIYDKENKRVKVMKYADGKYSL